MGRGAGPAAAGVHAERTLLPGGSAQHAVFAVPGRCRDLPRGEEPIDVRVATRDFERDARIWKAAEDALRRQAKATHRPGVKRGYHLFSST